MAAGLMPERAPSELRLHGRGWRVCAVRGPQCAVAHLRRPREPEILSRHRSTRAVHVHHGTEERQGGRHYAEDHTLRCSGWSKHEDVLHRVEHRVCKNGFWISKTVEGRSRSDSGSTVSDVRAEDGPDPTAGLDSPEVKPRRMPPAPRLPEPGNSDQVSEKRRTWLLGRAGEYMAKKITNVAHATADLMHEGAVAVQHGYGSAVTAVQVTAIEQIAEKSLENMPNFFLKMVEKLGYLDFPIDMSAVLGPEKMSRANIDLDIYEGYVDLRVLLENDPRRAEELKKAFDEQTKDMQRRLLTTPPGKNTLEKIRRWFSNMFRSKWNPCSGKAKSPPPFAYVMYRPGRGTNSSDRSRTDSQPDPRSESHRARRPSSLVEDLERERVEVLPTGFERAAVEELADLQARNAVLAERADELQHENAELLHRIACARGQDACARNLEQ